MWQTMVLTTMLAAAGYYSMTQAIAMPSPPPALSSELATSMAIYRQAVLDYLKSNPDFQGTSIPYTNVKALLPSWYVDSNGQQSSLTWANQICSNKTVVVYAASPLQVSIINDLIKLSKNSATVGESLGDTSIYSPALAFSASALKGTTNAGTRGTISLSGCATSMAAGVPVWISRSN